MKNNKKSIFTILIILSISLVAYFMQSYHKKSEYEKMTLKSEVKTLQIENKALLNKTLEITKENNSLKSKLESEKKNEKIVSKKFYPDGKLKTVFIKDKSSEKNSEEVDKNESKDNKKDSLTVENNTNVTQKDEKVDFQKEKKKEEVKKSNWATLGLVAGGIVLCFATGICVLP